MPFKRPEGWRENNKLPDETICAPRATNWPRPAASDMTHTLGRPASRDRNTRSSGGAWEWPGELARTPTTSGWQLAVSSLTSEQRASLVCLFLVWPPAGRSLSSRLASNASCTWPPAQPTWRPSSVTITMFMVMSIRRPACRHASGRRAHLCVFDKLSFPLACN